MLLRWRGTLDIHGAPETTPESYREFDEQVTGGEHNLIVPICDGRHQMVRISGLRRILSSCVISVKPSAFAWAASIRSKGSA